MKFVRAPSAPLLREFWLGLTTPDWGVLKMAAVVLLILLGIVSAMAVNFRKRIEAGKVDWRVMSNDFCRSSIIAASGAARETDPSAKNFVFVGPSALRCWLPKQEEVDALASSTAGSPVRVLVMCSGRQSYACTSALIDRFGADFNGWFVIGVTRQMIGQSKENTEFYKRQSRALCFDSELLRENAAFLGYPQDRATGWELWDHRAFYQQSKLGWHPPFSKRQAYNPYVATLPIPSDPVAAGIRPFDAGLLERNLTVLKKVADQVRAKGRARVALVETPWVDTFDHRMQTPEWRRDEDAYQRTMREWSRQNDVPWITSPAGFEVQVADFADVRHIGTPEPRRKFLETVVRELSSH